MTLGQKIRKARLDRGLTQKQLVGDHITRNMLSKIENDSATPSVRTLEYLAGRLGLSAGYFMTDFVHSDGTSPDGLDDMRAAYREGRFKDCIALLEKSKTAGTTDEGYLLHAISALAAAHECLNAGDIAAAKEFADDADYYNKEGLYYSAQTDAEMSLILAECALELDSSEFEPNAIEYERAAKSIDFTPRYLLARAEYLLNNGERELAHKILYGIPNIPEDFAAKGKYLKGIYLMLGEDYNSAVEELSEAESLLTTGGFPSLKLYAALEQCYNKLENFKQAYHYASKQLR